MHQSCQTDQQTQLYTAGWQCIHYSRRDTTKSTKRYLVDLRTASKQAYLFVKSTLPGTKVLSQSTSGFGFFLYQSTDLDELYKAVTSVFLISEH